MLKIYSSTLKLVQKKRMLLTIKAQNWFHEIDTLHPMTCKITIICISFTFTFNNVGFNSHQNFHMLCENLKYTQKKTKQISVFYTTTDLLQVSSRSVDVQENGGQKNLFLTHNREWPLSRAVMLTRPAPSRPRPRPRTPRPRPWHQGQGQIGKNKAYNADITLISVQLFSFSKLKTLSFCVDLKFTKFHK